MSEAAEAGDAFLGGRLRIVQPEGGHRAGIDAVMLAAAVRVPSDGRMLDAGAGAGVVGLCVAARVPGCQVTGIEIDPEMAQLATANAVRNGMGRRYSCINADVTERLHNLAPAGLTPDSYEAVAANPPYYLHGRATASLEPRRARASIMAPGDLDLWIRAMTAFTVPGGMVTLVHPATALATLLGSLDGRCGNIVVFPLYPRAGEPAHRIIVAGIKGSRAPLAIRAGLVLHGEGNAFTPHAEAVLRDGQPIDLGF